VAVGQGGILVGGEEAPAPLQERLFRQPGVASIKSSVVLREVKYDTALPVPG
jgi:hypothetical protein